MAMQETTEVVVAFELVRYSWNRPPVPVSIMMIHGDSAQRFSNLADVAAMCVKYPLVPVQLPKDSKLEGLKNLSTTAWYSLQTQIAMLLQESEKTIRREAAMC